MATPPAPPLDTWGILSESKRIINRHSRHFLALSVIFLLPLAFSITVYPTIHHLLTDSPSDNSQVFLRLPSHQNQPIPTKTLTLALAYSLFVFIYSLCAVGTITYSVFHGFYGRPVKLISAIKSIFTSFFPLLATALLSQVIVFLICITFVLLLFLVVRGIELMGFQIQYYSPYFNGFLTVFTIVLISLLAYLKVNWTLACVIVVVESSWGLEPLKRSKSLVKGMRRVAWSLLLLFASCLWFLVWFGSVSSVGADETSNVWKSWAFVFQIVITSTFLVLLLLYYVAANTVLYMYSRAINGELAVEIAEEFAREYVSLPFDDGKAPHVVSVVSV